MIDARIDYRKEWKIKVTGDVNIVALETCTLVDTICRALLKRDKIAAGVYLAGIAKGVAFVSDRIMEEARGKN